MTSQPTAAPTFTRSECDPAVEGPCKECVLEADPWCSVDWNEACDAACVGLTQYASKSCEPYCKQPPKPTPEPTTPGPTDAPVADGANANFLTTDAPTPDPLAVGGGAEPPPRRARRRRARRSSAAS